MVKHEKKLSKFVKQSSVGRSAGATIEAKIKLAAEGFEPTTKGL